MNIARAILPSSGHLYKQFRNPTPSIMGTMLSTHKKAPLAVLKCDSSSIVFPPTIDSSDPPQVADSKTAEALRLAVHHLVTLDDVVAFPTETVYGLGANALSPAGVSPIFSTKGRHRTTRSLYMSPLLLCCGAYCQAITYHRPCTRYSWTHFGRAH